MPNRDTHLLAGAAVGGLTYIIGRLIQREEINFWSLLLSIGGGAIAGELPDIIEPATNPNHRASVHSIAAGSFVIYGSSQVITSDMDSDTQAILAAIAAGFLTHLVLDSTTPKGLPVL